MSTTKPNFALVTSQRGVIHLCHGGCGRYTSDPEYCYECEQELIAISADNPQSPSKLQHKLLGCNPWSLWDYVVAVVFLCAILLLYSEVGTAAFEWLKYRLF